MQLVFSQTIYVWIGLAIVFGIFELLLPYFGLLFAAFAALVSALAAALQLSLPMQGVVFIVSLAVGLFFLRPRLVRKIQSRGGVPSRTDVLLGKRGHVTESIDPLTGRGRVDIEGHDWAAQSPSAISKGSAVIVDSADGIVLNVKEG